MKASKPIDFVYSLIQYLLNCSIANHSSVDRSIKESIDQLPNYLNQPTKLIGFPFFLISKYKREFSNSLVLATRPIICPA